MDTIFMNSKNSKTSDHHRVLLNLADKINLKRSDEYVVISNRTICYIRKNIKKLLKNNNLKYQLQNRMNSLNYLKDHILYHIFKQILNVY